MQLFQIDFKQRRGEGILDNDWLDPIYVVAESFTDAVQMGQQEAVRLNTFVRELRWMGTAIVQQQVQAP